MKVHGWVMFIPAAFVLGGIIGGWTERDAFRRYRELQESKPAAKESKGLDRFAMFGEALNIPKKAKNPKPWRRAEALATAKGDKKAGEKSAEDVPQTVDEARDEYRSGRWRMGRSEEDLGARIDEAKEIWETRRQIARANFFEKFNIAAEKQEAFDKAVERMNVRLQAVFQAVGQQLEGDGQFTPELGARLIGDLGDTFAEAYDGIGACADESRRAEIGEQLLHDFIDPEVAEPLVPVQEKLREGPVGMREAEERRAAEREERRAQKAADGAVK